jgi:hypothetical protein
MKTETDYRPSNIEFEVANISTVPDNLGKFENAKEATDFMHLNVTAINQKIYVNRFMDNFEKNEIRKDCMDLLENKLPLLEKELQKATYTFTQAKKELAEATEACNATTNEAKALAIEVKRGTKVINLDDQFTWRVPFENRYYYYTFIDLQVKLCKISDIPEHEKTELWNAMSQNDKFFNDNFGTDKSE